MSISKVLSVEEIHELTELSKDEIDETIKDILKHIGIKNLDPDNLDPKSLRGGK